MLPLQSKRAGAQACSGTSGQNIECAQISANIKSVDGSSVLVQLLPGRGSAGPRISRRVNEDGCGGVAPPNTRASLRRKPSPTRKGSPQMPNASLRASERIGRRACVGAGPSLLLEQVGVWHANALIACAARPCVTSRTYDWGAWIPIYRTGADRPFGPGMTCL